MVSRIDVAKLLTVKFMGAPPSMEYDAIAWMCESFTPLPPNPATDVPNRR